MSPPCSAMISSLIRRTSRITGSGIRLGVGLESIVFIFKQIFGGANYGQPFAQEATVSRKRWRILGFTICLKFQDTRKSIR